MCILGPFVSRQEFEDLYDGACLSVTRLLLFGALVVTMDMLYSRYGALQIVVLLLPHPDRGTGYCFR